MKKSRVYFLVFILVLITSSCYDSYISTDSYEDNSGLPEIVVPNTVTTENIEDDPHETGCSSMCETGEINILDIIEIPILPNSFDLSEMMPPVRSQGTQGSCVAWATTYYLKSYQEKIQHEYEYLTYNEIMSPAFVYNQIKIIDCMSGSCIPNALDLLKDVGCLSWQDFPYSPTTCSTLPNESQLESANVNKIGDWYKIEVPIDVIVDENYTLINIIKTLISQENPLILSVTMNRLDFQYVDDIYIANNSTDITGSGHAMVIVGYDDEKNAFKVVNSWGTSWGNEGYAYINYNFFKEEGEIDFQEGIGSVYIAYDADDE